MAHPSPTEPMPGPGPERLSSRLLEVQEAERRRMARELHDELGQVLTAAKLALSAARRQDGAGPVSPHIQTASELVNQAIDRVRRLALDLRPPSLDDLGLLPALRAHLRRQADASGVRIEVRARELTERLPERVETAAFRIVQEAVTNALRHARTDRIDAEIAVSAGTLHVTVSDRGVGFDLSQAHRRAQRGESVGLLSMDERASLAGGRLAIESAPGSGTTVRATFILDGRANQRIPSGFPR